MLAHHELFTHNVIPNIYLIKTTLFIFPWDLYVLRFRNTTLIAIIVLITGIFHNIVITVATKRRYNNA